MALVFRKTSMNMQPGNHGESHHVERRQISLNADDTVLKCL